MEKAGDVLRSLLGASDLERGERIGGLFRGWESVAGEPLAAHSRVVEIERGCVVVEVDHPGWFQTFRFSEKRILEELGRRYPDLGIRGIKVRVVPRRARQGGEDASRAEG